MIAWTLLFLAALFDAVRHRHIKRRGSQLPWGILAVLAASMVQEILLLTYSVLLNKHNPNADDVRKAYYVFDDLEDSMFMVCSPSNLHPSNLQLRVTFCVPSSFHLVTASQVIYLKKLPVLSSAIIPVLIAKRFTYPYTPTQFLHTQLSLVAHPSSSDIF